MGYLTKNLRRGAARRQKLDLLSRELSPAVWQWLDAPDTPPPADPTAYVRLATDAVHAASGQFFGIFAAAYELRGSGKLSADDVVRLRRCLRWFGHHLHAPKQVPPLAVFWFRTDATLFTRRVWSLVRVLRRNGARVKSMTTRKPGRIVYRDAAQIAAIPNSFMAVEGWA